jgi:hypothetical protein
VKEYDEWLTPDQHEIDSLALSLFSHPDVKAARARGVARLQGSLQAEVFDAPATFDAAVEELLFAALQTAANDDPGRPKAIWSCRMPYTVDGQRVPGCRYIGDLPDRVYRNICVSTDFRYEIVGWRHPTHPSVDDFSVDSLLPPVVLGHAQAALQAPDGIDVDDDGSFTITADATPADGRRNHLHLPPGTKTIWVRDTLQDWAGQVPNRVSVRLLDGTPGPARTRDETAANGVAIFNQCIDMTLALFENSLMAQPVNTLTAFLRGVNWGVAGAVLAYNRFELDDDEALIITLNPISARYLGVVATDPWMCSIPYDIRCSSLNNVQAQANTDGSYTFVLGPRDPGVHNWIDTAGLRTGIMLARWELLSETPAVAAETDGKPAAMFAPENTVHEAVGETRVVKVGDVPGAVPPGQARVTLEEREELVAARAASYQVRVTGEPVAARKI